LNYSIRYMYLSCTLIRAGWGKDKTLLPAEFPTAACIRFQGIICYLLCGGGATMAAKNYLGALYHTFDE